ncbi:4321_t:CDS:1, partial [Gigaspora rosea]
VTSCRPSPQTRSGLQQRWFPTHTSVESQQSPPTPPQTRLLSQHKLIVHSCVEVQHSSPQGISDERHEGPR